MACIRRINVPDEILVEIFSQLRNGFIAEIELLRWRHKRPNRSKRDRREFHVSEREIARALHVTLNAVCLTSRQFRRTAQLLLYECVPMCNAKYWMDPFTGIQQDGFQPLPQLLFRTLSESPDLRERVRILRWDDLNWTHQEVAKYE